MPGLPLAPMSHRFFLTSVLCVTSIFATFPSGIPIASAMPVRSSAMIGRDATVAMLGLEGPQEMKAKAMTDALRRALEARGMLTGEQLTVGEVRLMMGCDDTSATCLAQAGTSMGVEKVVYGSLETEGDAYRLVLTVLDVATGADDSQTSYPLMEADLAEAAIDDKASKIVLGLFPPTPEPVSAPPPAPEVVAATSDREATRADSKYVWGAYKPRPAWKWAGLGTGLGLTAAGVGLIIGTGLTLQGPLRDELLDAARDSLTDTDEDGNLNPANDVNPYDPEISRDLCAAGRAEPDDQPGRVTNASITSICNRADTMETLNYAGIGIAAAGAVTTIVFTTLLFVHRRNPRRAAWMERFQLGATPGRGGGSVMGELRF